MPSPLKSPIPQMTSPGELQTESGGTSSTSRTRRCALWPVYTNTGRPETSSGRLAHKRRSGTPTGMGRWPVTATSRPLRRHSCPSCASYGSTASRRNRPSGSRHSSALPPDVQRFRVRRTRRGSCPQTPCPHRSRRRRSGLLSPHSREPAPPQRCGRVGSRRASFRASSAESSDQANLIRSVDRRDTNLFLPSGRYGLRVLQLVEGPRLYLPGLSRGDGRGHEDS